MTKQAIILTDKQNKDLLDKIEGSIKISKEIHPGWLEMQKAVQKGLFTEKERASRRARAILSNVFGKWRYLIESPKGRYSLIQINVAVPSNWANTFNYPKQWESYNFETRAVMRFKTKAEAMKRIKKVLQ